MDRRRRQRRNNGWTKFDFTFKGSSLKYHNHKKKEKYNKSHHN
jgi:hypothetical protein